MHRRRMAARLPVPAIVGGLLTAALATAGCTSLPATTPGACGNGIIEPELGEDCDRPDADCGAPTTATACRLLCATAVDCPATAACGQDGACHVPDGSFGLVDQASWTSPALLIGDVDGDARVDLVGVDDVAVDLRSGLGGGRFGAGVTLASLAVNGSPTIADVTGDGVDDVVLSVGFGVHLLSSAADGAFGPTFQPSGPLGASAGQLVLGMLRLVDETGLPEAAISAATRIPAGPDCPLPAGCDVFLVAGDTDVGVGLPHHPEQLVSRRLPVARLPDTDQFVVALGFSDDPAVPLDQSGVYVVRVDLADRALPVVDDAVEVLVPGKPSAVGFNDLDGDGIADLVVGYAMGQVTEVGRALGRSDGSFAPMGVLRMTRFDDPLAVPGPVPVPVAWGDLDGDGADELISADGAWKLICSGTTCVGGMIAQAPAPWREAMVSDLNGDGRPDLAAARGGGSTVDVLFGTSVLGFWNDASFAAPGQVSFLRGGDFDGNGVGDVALVAEGADGESADLVVAFGQLGAGLTAPVAMGAIGSPLGVEPIFLPTLGHFDLADDLLLAFDRNEARSLSFAFGAVGRRMIAPYLFDLDGTKDGATTLIQAVVPIELDDDPAVELAAVVRSVAADGEIAVTLNGLDVNGPGDIVAIGAGTPVDAADLGRLDIASARWVTVPATSTTTAVVIGAGRDGGAVAVPVGACPGPGCGVGTPRILQAGFGLVRNTDLIVADLDGAGALDVVLAVADDAARSSDVLIWRDAASAADPEVVAVPTGVRAVSVAALRATVDGPAWLVIAAKTPGAGGEVLVAEPDAAGRYGAFRSLGLPIANAIGVRVADVDEDGLDDLLVLGGADPQSPRTVNVFAQGEIAGGAGLAAGVGQ